GAHCRPAVTSWLGAGPPSRWLGGKLHYCCHQLLDSRRPKAVPTITKVPLVRSYGIEVINGRKAQLVETALKIRRLETTEKRLAAFCYNFSDDRRLLLLLRAENVIDRHEGEDNPASQWERAD